MSESKTNSATIFNIQRYSLHDGPGIRTTVFLKGCPLSCLWCHNPESQRFHKELLFYQNKCISCGSCATGCPTGGAADPKACIQCGSCCEECPTNARAMAGKDMTVAEVVAEIEKDRIFYDQSDGGVTISGGEPLSHFDFLLELASTLKQKRFHVTVDTCGFTSWGELSAIAEHTDLFLYDLKFADNQKHVKYTGVPNTEIIDNLIRLHKAGKNIIIRIPIIPSINDSMEDISGLIDLLTANGIHSEVNLLPYHNISMEKYNRLHRDYALQDIKEPTTEHMEELKTIFEEKGYKTRIGG